MNNNNANPKKHTPQLWSRWGTEFQVTLLFSALASGAITSAEAQAIEAPKGTAVADTIFLDEDGEILNNTGEINVSGAKSAPITSIADNTIINNGTTGDPGTIIGESRAIDIISGSGATINNSAGSEIIASGGQGNGAPFINTAVDNVTLDKQVSFIETGLNTDDKFKGEFSPKGQGNGTIFISRNADNVTLNNEGSIIANGDQGKETPYFDISENDVIIGEVGSTFNKDVFKGNLGAGISIQSGEGISSHTIINNGSIEGLGFGATAGIHVFGTSGFIIDNDVTNFKIVESITNLVIIPDKKPVSTADITITNGIDGIISSQSSAGILIEDVTFTGSIQNSGEITGATAAIDTSRALGDITIDQLDGSLNGGVFTGSGNDQLNISGNSTLSGPIDLGGGSNTVNVLAGGTANFANNFFTFKDFNLRSNSDFFFGNVIVNSDLNVDGTLGLSLESPLTVEGITTFTEGSTIFLDAQGSSFSDTLNPTVVLSSDAIIGSQHAELQDNSIFRDFTSVDTGVVFVSDSFIETASSDAILTNLDNSNSVSSSLVVQASAADLTQELNDDNVISFGQALQSVIEDELENPTPKIASELASELSVVG